MLPWTAATNVAIITKNNILSELKADGDWYTLLSSRIYNISIKSKKWNTLEVNA